MDRQNPDNPFRPRRDDNAERAARPQLKVKEVVAAAERMRAERGDMIALLGQEKLRRKAKDPH